MCPPPNADVPGGQGFAPLVDGDANKPTDPMAVLLSSASLRLRGLLLRRFLRDLPVPGISTLLAAVVGGIDRLLRRGRYSAGVLGTGV